MALAARAPPWNDPRAAARVSVRLAIAVAASAAALVIVAFLEPFLGLPVLFPAFVAIVVVSAGAAGTGYGILTAALFGVAHAFFFMEPRQALVLDDPRSWGILVAFLIAGLLVSFMGGALRKAHALAREQHRSLAEVHDQREDLLRALTHDVRTPLSAISMHAAMLGRATGDPAVQSRARAIQTSAARVARMLGDLVETVHLESGHLQIQRVPVDLSSFVGELRSRLDGTMPLERVRFDIPDRLPAVHLDPARFERIVVNLLSNALKYAPPPSPVVLGVALQDADVVVSVADAGPGISAEDLPRIFDKYFRATGTRSKEGLGIGLYATRMLVQAHGGRVWAESTVGQGTTFHVALPIASAEAPRTGAAQRWPAPSEARDAAGGSRGVRVPAAHLASAPGHHPGAR